MEAATLRALKKAELLLEVYNHSVLVRDPYHDTEMIAKYVLVERDEGRSNAFFPRELLNELVAEGHVVKQATASGIYWLPAHQKLIQYVRHS